MSQSLSAALETASQRRSFYRQQPIQTTHCRTGAALLLNVEHAANVWGTRAGFMTLTFQQEVDPYEAVHRIKKLVRKFTKLFPAWFWVLEFGPGRRPHFHLLVDTQHDIRSGFDPAAYDTLKALAAQVRAEGRAFSPAETLLANSLKKALKVNPALKALQGDVRRLLSSARLGFGYHFELTPICKSPGDLAHYFRKNYFNAVRARHRRFPGVHLTASSRKFPKVCWSSFTLITSTSRFDYQAIGAALGIPDMAAMTHRFGSQWPTTLVPVMDELRFRFSKYPSLWPSRGIKEAIAAHIG